MIWGGGRGGRADTDESPILKTDDERYHKREREKKKDGAQNEKTWG
jgi:hypothetical protein